MLTRVLLCDTPDGLAQLQYALMKSGAALEIEVVTDGLRAVEVAARTQPALVVTEIGLEGLNGTDLIRRLLASVPETSVVCWTNVPSPVVSAQMLHDGASAYLLKEDGPEAVLRATRRARREVASAIAWGASSPRGWSARRCSGATSRSRSGTCPSAWRR